MPRKPSSPLPHAAHLERRFDGPIPTHACTPDNATALADRGALAMLERMLSEYLDEAERLERRIAELSESENASALDVAQARYAASIRSAGWAMSAVAAQRTKMSLPPHPITAAAMISKQAAE